MAKIALMIGIGILGAVTGGLGWLAFAGVAAGGAAGAIAGATLGMSLGGIVGSLLFPPNLGNQEGPRLGDLKVSTSTAGAAIPFGYNTDRHGANIIWSPGLVEHKSVEKHSAKGGPSYTTTTYSYTASFAAAFGEGPDIVHRIWGDTKLIYGTALYTEPNAESIRVEPLTLYCYTGSGTGIFTRTSVGSPAATFTNKIGLMFNTHPNVLLPGDPHDSADESFPPVHHPVTTYGTYGGDEVLTGCPVNTFDMIMTGKFIISVAGDYTFKAFADDGYFVGIAGTSLTSGPQLGSHPGTTPKMGYSVTWWSNQPQSYRDTGIHGDPAVVNFPSPGEYSFEICWTEDGSGQNQFSLMLGNVTEDADPANNVDALRAYKVIKPAVPVYEWIPYGIIAANVTSPPNYNTLVPVGAPAVQSGDYIVAEQVNASEPLDWQTVTWYFADAGHGQIGSSFQTKTNEPAITVAIPSGAVYLAVNTVTLTGVDATRYSYQRTGYETPPIVSPVGPKYPPPTIYPGDEIQNPDPTIQADQGAANVSANRGVCYAVWEDFPLADFGNRIPMIRGEVEFLLYDPAGNADNALPASALADQVEDLCIRATIPLADIDVSQLSGTCQGYMIGRPTSARSCLQPLAQAFFFDACESDGKIKFVPRGGTSVITIPEDDLGLEADKAKLTEQIGQEQDLPREVTILFSDHSLDYQQNKTSKRRSGRVVKTANQLTVELPIVMDKDMARQVAERALYLAYSERKPYELNLWKASYMVLDPCDVISFVYDGLTFEMRVVREGIGAGYTVALSGVSEDARNYLSTATGATNDGYVPGTVTPAAETLLWLFDLPLLRDADSVPGSTGYYFAMGTTAASWPGGLLFKSSDDVDFSLEGSSNSPVSFGVTTNALAAPSSPWSWDDDNTVNVILIDGSLAGATDLNVLNGQNALLLGSEVIQFGTCVQESDGSYTLSHLLRGRRGTEWACDTHVVNETVIDPYTGLEHMTAAMSLIGQDRFYKAVTAGQVLSNVTSQEFMLEGNDLKPYAPVHIEGSRASDDLTITWVRRTRLGGDWLDGAGDVPLSEDREMYEVDVLTGPLGSVVRTFSNLINPQVLYLSSDQVIDFGSAQSSVSVVVYQVSAQVGRGFAAEATI